MKGCKRWRGLELEREGKGLSVGVLHSVTHDGAWKCGIFDF